MFILKYISDAVQKLKGVSKKQDDETTPTASSEGDRKGRQSRFSSRCEQFPSGDYSRNDHEPDIFDQQFWSSRDDHEHDASDQESCSSRRYYHEHDASDQESCSSRRYYHEHDASDQESCSSCYDHKHDVFNQVSCWLRDNHEREVFDQQFLGSRDDHEHDVFNQESCWLRDDHERDIFDHQFWGSRDDHEHDVFNQESCWLRDDHERDIFDHQFWGSRDDHEHDVFNQESCWLRDDHERDIFDHQFWGSRDDHEHDVFNQESCWLRDDHERDIFDHQFWGSRDDHEHDVFNQESCWLRDDHERDIFDHQFWGSRDDHEHDVFNQESCWLRDDHERDIYDHQFWGSRDDHEHDVFNQESCWLRDDHERDIFDHQFWGSRDDHEHDVFNQESFSSRRYYHEHDASDQESCSSRRYYHEHDASDQESCSSRRYYHEHDASDQESCSSCYDHEHDVFNQESCWLRDNHEREEFDQQFWGSRDDHEHATYYQQSWEYGSTSVPTVQIPLPTNSTNEVDTWSPLRLSRHEHTQQVTSTADSYDRWLYSTADSALELSSSHQRSPMTSVPGSKPLTTSSGNVGYSLRASEVPFCLHDTSPYRVLLTSTTEIKPQPANVSNLGLSQWHYERSTQQVTTGQQVSTTNIQTAENRGRSSATSGRLFASSRNLTSTVQTARSDSSTKPLPERNIIPQLQLQALDEHMCSFYDRTFANDSQDCAEFWMQPSDRTACFPYRPYQVNSWFLEFIERDPSVEPGFPPLISMINLTTSSQFQTILTAVSKFRTIYLNDGDELYFHATDAASATSILINGIVLTKTHRRQDFSNGYGFYVTPNYTEATKWAHRKTSKCFGRAGAIIAFKISRSLQQEKPHIILDVKTEDGRKIWEKTVLHFRNGESIGSPSVLLSDVKFIRGPVSRTGFLRPGEKPMPHKNFTQICICDEGYSERFGNLGNICFVIFFKVN